MRDGRRRIYAGVLDIPEGESNGVRIRHMHKPAGWKTESGNLRTAMFGQKSESLVFKEPTRWHELSEDGQGVWMTDLSIEQRQMDTLISEGRAHGHVLLGGLGVGYAAVALAARKTVKSITVIERSKDVIKLVWQATVNRMVQFSRGSTAVYVIHADLFDFLKTTDQKFDWGLFDIWQGDGETTFHNTIVPLRKLAHGKVKQLTCWNEDICRAQLHNGMKTRQHFIEMPEDVLKQSGFDKLVPNLDTLCAPSDSVYIEWARPFWSWYREARKTEDPRVLNAEMARYAAWYGRPEREPLLLFPTAKVAHA